LELNERIFDLKPYLSLGKFSELKDPNKFKTADGTLGTLTDGTLGTLIGTLGTLIPTMQNY